MAWRIKDHYFQDSMTVLSGDTPEPGIKQSSAPIGDPNTNDSKVKNNGLYRLVWLIKQKFLAHDDALKKMWGLGQNGSKYQTLIGGTKSQSTDLDDYHEIGNYWWTSAHAAPVINLPKYPKVNTSTGDVEFLTESGGRFILKVSTFADATGYVQQDFQTVNEPNRRYHRFGQQIDATTDTWSWGPWMVVIDASTNSSAIPGTGDELFLRRKNHWTVGPTGFGKDPDPANTTDSSGALKAGIILGKYNYGTEEPDAHYSKAEFKNTNIPDGQIYFQYFETMEDLVTKLKS